MTTQNTKLYSMSLNCFLINNDLMAMIVILHFALHFDF